MLDVPARARRGLLAVALGAAVLSGCGEDASDTSGATAGPPSPAVTSTDPEAEAREKAEKALDEAEAEEVILTAGDLPDGYSEDPGAERALLSASADRPTCPARLDGLWVTLADAPVRLIRGFTSEDLKTVIQSVGSYGTEPEDLEALLESHRNAADECTAFTVTQPSGDFQVEAEQVEDFPELGDQSVTVRLRAARDGESSTARVTSYTRVGRIVIVTSIAAPGEVNLDLLEELQKQALARLPLAR